VDHGAKTVLSTFFSLLAPLAYIAYVRVPRGFATRRSSSCSLLADGEADAGPLPVLLLLLDEAVIHFREAVRLAPRRRSPRAARGGAREERSRRRGRQGVDSWISGLKTGGRLWNGAGSPPAHTVRGLLRFLERK
jgi:hypothetical protein